MRMMRRMMFPAPAVTQLSNLLHQMKDQGGGLINPENAVFPEIYGYPYPEECHVYPPYPYSEQVSINVGQNLDPKFLRVLSSTQFIRYSKYLGDEHHIDFASLRQKYLLVCCISLPQPTGSYIAQHFNSLLDTYNRLRKYDDFEVILVIKLKTPLDTYEPKFVFDHFVSSFPFLAIPFSQSDTRDSICSSIKPDSAFLVNPDRLVLQNESVLNFLTYFGCEWRAESRELGSFLRSTLEFLGNQDFDLRSKFDPMYTYSAGPVVKDCSPPSLFDILECDAADEICRFGGESCQMRDLTETYVGLYLCLDGMFMKQLKAAHDHCLANNQPLEIVVVCVSVFDATHFFLEDLVKALNLFNVSSWFVYQPKDDMVVRRIWRIYGQKYPGDGFIIIPPIQMSGFGELEGRAVVTKIGINNYPFTRSTILNQRLEALGPLTTSKLLTELETWLVCNGVKSIPTLKDKKLLLYLDRLEREEFGGLVLYNMMLKLYPEIQAMDCEVVFVSLGDVVLPNVLDEMPWPYVDPSNPFKDRVVNHLVFPEDNELGGYVIAVEKDGRILSRQAHEGLATRGLTKSLFEDLLYKELASQLSNLDQE